MPGLGPIGLWQRRATWSAVAAVLVMLTALVGCSSAPPVPPPPVAPQLRTALEHWSAFPAGAAARPLVVETGADVTGPPGFPNGADEDAFNDGSIRLPRSLPAGPATMGGFPLISATSAAARFQPGRLSGRSPAPSPRLIVTGVKLGTAVFGTDRGRQALPAWRFSFRGITGTANVLAVSGSRRFWPSGLGQVPTPMSAAQPGRSGRMLTLTTVGAQAGTGPCQASYSARQRSSGHAVAIYVVAVEHGGAQMCGAAGFQVTLPVTLPAPLGNRVLVDALTFAPIPVTQSLVSSS